MCCAQDNSRRKEKRAEEAKARGEKGIRPKAFLAGLSFCFLSCSFVVSFCVVRKEKRTEEAKARGEKGIRSKAFLAGLSFCFPSCFSALSFCRVLRGSFVGLSFLRSLPVSFSPRWSSVPRLLRWWVLSAPLSRVCCFSVPFFGVQKASPATNCGLKTRAKKVSCSSKRALQNVPYRFLSSGRGFACRLF